MISIGQLAKLANTSTRSLRFYEAQGLIKSKSRGENNYRYFEVSQITEVKRIKELQALGFSLVEIKMIQKISQTDFLVKISKKLEILDQDLLNLKTRKLKLQGLLSVSKKIDIGLSINKQERTEYMTAIEEVLKSLQIKRGAINQQQLDYLKRDYPIGEEKQNEFLEGLKQCLSFAKEQNLHLGPVRGSASSSIILYALGLSPYDPSEHGLIPERLLTSPPNIHIDVEFERGQAFVDYCQSMNK